MDIEKISSYFKNRGIEFISLPKDKKIVIINNLLVFFLNNNNLSCKITFDKNSSSDLLYIDISILDSKKKDDLILSPYFLLRECFYKIRKKYQEEVIKGKIIPREDESVVKAWKDELLIKREENFYQFYYSIREKDARAYSEQLSVQFLNGCGYFNK